MGRGFWRQTKPATLKRFDALGIQSTEETRGVVFTEDVVKITGQQGRYAVGHGFREWARGQDEKHLRFRINHRLNVVLDAYENPPDCGAVLSAPKKENRS
jgi:hypothetical protein